MTDFVAKSNAFVFSREGKFTFHASNALLTTDANMQVSTNRALAKKANIRPLRGTCARLRRWLGIRSSLVEHVTMNKRSVVKHYSTLYIRVTRKRLAWRMRVPGYVDTGVAAVLGGGCSTP